MLILTRKLGQTIRIGNEIEVTILETKGKQIKIGIAAPLDIAVHRGEVYQMIREQNALAAGFDDYGNRNLADIWNRLKKSREEEDRK